MIGDYTRNQMINVCTYAWLAGVALLMLGGAELAGFLEIFEHGETVFLVAAGTLLIWEGVLQRKRCKHVVGAIGSLCLLAGMFVPIGAVLTEALAVSPGTALEALFAVVFGLLSIFAAAVLPAPVKDSDRVGGESSG